MAQKDIDWFEKKGEQKPANKVEPKFKVGDWVVSNLYTSKPFCITKICDTHYLVDNDSFIPFEQESDWRLWTIQDAKDGDILFAKGSYFKEYIFIYSGMTEDNVMSTYCGFDMVHNNFDTKLSRFGRMEDFEAVFPVTKEQRGLLFQKMKEEGYEWDDEKKELKKIEHKPADRIEPKFKVGDWIIYNKNIELANSLMLVTGKDDNEYLCNYRDGQCSYNIEFIDKEYRLWTIQDAKDGDVLAYENDIVIFKENNYNSKDKSGCMFVHCSCNNFYEIGGINPTDYKPATKKQLNILFQKMKEAGYEWDAEKKELRKVEQKLTDKIQPKFKVGDIIKNKKNGDTVKVEQILSDSYCYSGWDGAATIHSDFLISDQGNWELVEQKPADNEMIEILRTEYEKGRADAITEFQKEWGEEDEKNYDILLKIICSSNKSEELVNKLFDWFKSIKDRVQPQNLIITDDELAQAKKDAYNNALDKIEYHSGEPTFDDGWSAAIWYLKKRNAQPRNRWKPSEEQMKALHAKLSYVNGDRELVPDIILESLYNDLKKLKG